MSFFDMMASNLMIEKLLIVFQDITLIWRNAVKISETYTLKNKFY